eukprot:scaffold82903_cov34-Prasinocladus_malaysianus.AAC.2
MACAARPLRPPAGALSAEVQQGRAGSQAGEPCVNTWLSPSARPSLAAEPPGSLGRLRCRCVRRPLGAWGRQHLWRAKQTRWKRFSRYTKRGLAWVCLAIAAAREPL